MATGLVAALQSWSATRRHPARTGVNPVEAATLVLATAWGDQQRVCAVRWPFLVRVGRVG